MVAYSIMAEAGLSFIGLGDRSMMSWGLMLYFSSQTRAIAIPAWWVFVPPGVAILLVVISLVFIGQALDELLNPKLSERMIS